MTVSALQLFVVAQSASSQDISIVLLQIIALTIPAIAFLSQAILGLDNESLSDATAYVGYSPLQLTITGFTLLLLAVLLQLTNILAGYFGFVLFSSASGFFVLSGSFLLLIVLFIMILMISSAQQAKQREDKIEDAADEYLSEYQSLAERSPEKFLWEMSKLEKESPEVYESIKAKMYSDSELLASLQLLRSTKPREKILRYGYRTDKDAEEINSNLSDYTESHNK